MRSILSVVAVVSVAGVAAAQQFPVGLHLYSAPEGMTQTLWLDVPLAKDGSAVGATYEVNGVRYGARITPAGMVNFPEPSSVYDISNGGEYTVDAIWRRSASGVIDQVFPPGTLSWSFKPSVSGDGQTIAIGLEDETNRSYLWTNQGGLSALPEYSNGAGMFLAEDLSEDGGTIVGTGWLDTLAAWKWTAGSGYTMLPWLPGSRSHVTTADGVNGDGSIIVGSGDDASGQSWGVVWRNGQIIGLPPLPGYRGARAYDLSDDGSVITGIMDGSSGLSSAGAIWTEASGWMLAADYFQMHGIAIPSNLELAMGSKGINISADGRTFSMYARDVNTNEYFTAIVAVPSPGVVPVLGLAYAFVRRRRVCVKH